MRVLDIQSQKFLEDPYACYADLLAAGGIGYDPSVNAYFAGNFSDVVKILSDPMYTTAPLMQRAEPVMRGRVLAQMSGIEHAKKRRIVARGFNTNNIKQNFVPRIRENAFRLLAKNIEKTSFDLVSDFGRDLAVLVTLDILGLPHENYKLIGEWHRGIADFITSIKITPEKEAYDLECSQKLADYLKPFVEERRKAPGDDLISNLCHAEIDGQRMSDSEIIALCLNIMLAATEPADKTIALLFRNLIQHPEQMAAVRADRSLLVPAIDESLRLSPPVQLIPRQPESDSVLSEVKIPAGSLLFCLIGAANRDPKVFKDPDVFNLHRMVNVGESASKLKHLAYGTGMHVCVGALFAQMEIETVANVILDCAETIEFAQGFEYRESGLYTRGPDALVVSVKKSSVGAPI